MTSPLRLHYAPDNASLCIRLALEACRLPYRATLVDRAARAQDSDAYRRVNPAGLIPALETPAGPMFETGAILLWLSEQPGGEALMPGARHPDRALALSWLFWLANTLHPRLRMLFYPDKYAPPGAVDALSAATREGIARALDLVEAAAARQPGWLGPGTASAHLCYLCPMLRWLALYPRDTAGWLRLESWPHLYEIAKVTEATDWAIAAARAEGLGKTFFSTPSLPEPPEGSAT